MSDDVDVERGRDIVIALMREFADGLTKAHDDPMARHVFRDIVTSFDDLHVTQWRMFSPQEILGLLLTHAVTNVLVQHHVTDDHYFVDAAEHVGDVLLRILAKLLESSPEFATLIRLSIPMRTARQLAQLTTLPTATEN